MPSTVTLGSTTLSEAVGLSDGSVKLASTSGVFPGYRLFIDGELFRVISLGVDSNVNVTRGVDGSKASAHVSGLTVYIGQAHQFYSKDPVGRPQGEIPVSPYINVTNGTVWFAQGDALPIATANRWWQKQTPSYGTTSLGVRTTTLDPSSSA